MSSDQNIVDLVDVTKTYRPGVGRARVREMIPPPFDRRLQSWFRKWWWRDTFDALDCVTLPVERGAAIGVVGHNGAGKTTLLKVVAGVVAPTSGVAITRGRVAALIDVIVGFHPDLTGIENAYLLAAMFGVQRKAMRPRIPDVFDFAEIESDLAGTPVKRYSAGMMSRLGFGIVTAVDADVLLVDEVLSVGDAAFQRKCIEWLAEYRDSGGTLIFVSHNLGLVRTMTDQCVWLDHGKVTASGSTSRVLATYAGAMESRIQGDTKAYHGHRRALAAQLASRGEHRWGAGGARIEEVHVNHIDGKSGSVEMSINYTAQAALDDAFFCVGFVDESEREVGAAVSPTFRLTPLGGKVVCAIEPVPFRSGVYFPVVGIVAGDGRVHDRWRLDRAIVIEPNGGFDFSDFGPVEIESAWADDA